MSVVKVGIDLDGVLLDFEKDFIVFMLMHAGEYDAVDASDINYLRSPNWDMHYEFMDALVQKANKRAHELGHKALADVHAWMDEFWSRKTSPYTSPWLPENIPFYRKQVEDQIMILLDEGHDVVFVTARGTIESENAHLAKIDALMSIQHWYPSLSHLPVIFAYDKTSVGLDVLIDDSPVNLHAAYNKGIYTIKINHLYNKNVTTQKSSDNLLSALVEVSNLKLWTDVDFSYLENTSKIASPQPEEASAEFRYLDDITFVIQDQLEGKAADIKSSTAPAQTNKVDVHVDPTTGAQKQTKLACPSLIPPKALMELAERFGYGIRSGRYSKHNWRRGYEWSVSMDALMRHLFAFWDGEDYDLEAEKEMPGCKFKHIIAVAWHAIVLSTFMDEHPEKDDRFRGQP